MTANPDVKIVERGTGTNLDEYSPKLTQWLAAGRGAGDVVAIEEGLIVEYKANPGNFVNLLDHGAADLKGNFLRMEVERRPDRRRQAAHRPRHRRRRHRHVLPQGPLREGRPAHRPRRGLQALADLAGLHRHR